MRLRSLVLGKAGLGELVLASPSNGEKERTWASGELLTGKWLDERDEYSPLYCGVIRPVWAMSKYAKLAQFVLLILLATRCYR